MLSLRSKIILGLLIVITFAPFSRLSAAEESGEIIVMLDQSGSMEGYDSKLLAQVWLNSFVGTFDGTYRIVLVGFDELTQVHSTFILDGAFDKSELLAKIQSIPTKGLVTDLEEPFRYVLERGSHDRLKMAILLTDGKPQIWDENIPYLSKRVLRDHRYKDLNDRYYNLKAQGLSEQNLFARLGEAYHQRNLKFIEQRLVGLEEFLGQKMVIWDISGRSKQLETWAKKAAAQYVPILNDSTKLPVEQLNDSLLDLQKKASVLIDEDLPPSYKSEVEMALKTVPGISDVPKREATETMRPVEPRLVTEGEVKLHEKKRALEEKKSTLENDIRALEKEKRVLQREVRALKGRKRALGSDGPTFEGEERALEETKRALEERSRALEMGQRSLDEEERVLQKEGLALKEKARALKSGNRTLQNKELTSEEEIRTSVTSESEESELQREERELQRQERELQRQERSLQREERSLQRDERTQKGDSPEPIGSVSTPSSASGTPEMDKTVPTGTPEMDKTVPNGKDPVPDGKESAKGVSVSTLLGVLALLALAGSALFLLWQRRQRRAQPEGASSGAAKGPAGGQTATEAAHESALEQLKGPAHGRASAAAGQDNRFWLRIPTPPGFMFIHWIDRDGAPHIGQAINISVHGILFSASGFEDGTIEKIDCPGFAFDAKVIKATIKRIENGQVAAVIDTFADDTNSKMRWVEIVTRINEGE